MSRTENATPVARLLATMTEGGVAPASERGRTLLEGVSTTDPFSSGPGVTDPIPFPDPTLDLDRGPRPPWAR